jgi:hypothetical protein
VIPSRDVADFFGKDHKNVLRDIREIIENSPKTGQPNFRQSSFTNDQMREMPCFTMTRDGFSVGELLPIKGGFVIGGDAIETVNARDLHAFLGGRPAKEYALTSARSSKTCQKQTSSILRRGLLPFLGQGVRSILASP